MQISFLLEDRVFKHSQSQQIIFFYYRFYLMHLGLWQTAVFFQLVVKIITTRKCSS